MCRHICLSVQATAPLNCSISGSLHLCCSLLHKMNSAFITPAQASQGVKKEKKRPHIFFLSSLGTSKEPPFFSLRPSRLPLSLKSVSGPANRSHDGAGAIQGVIFSGDTDALKKVLQQMEGKRMCFLSSHVLRLGVHSRSQLNFSRNGY